MSLLKIAKNLRKLAARDYRFSQLKDELESVIPELMQYERGGDTTVVRSKQESEALQSIISNGVFLEEASRNLRRVSASLSSMLEELGKAMQGIG